MNVELEYVCIILIHAYIHSCIFTLTCFHYADAIIHYTGFYFIKYCSGNKAKLVSTKSYAYDMSNKLKMYILKIYEIIAIFNNQIHLLVVVGERQ